MLIACCPACGHHIANITEGARRSLRHNETGRLDQVSVRKVHPLECTNPRCPRPMAALELLTQAQETKHIVVFKDDGFEMKHPLIERLADELFDCEMHRYLSERVDRVTTRAVRHVDERDVQTGVRYRVWLDHEDTTWGPLQWVALD